MIMSVYDREAAVAYARRYAARPNPRYFDFTPFGGDSVNFVSQALYAGAGVMNYSTVYGWFYVTAGERTAAWADGTELMRFLLENRSVGPYGVPCDPDGCLPGDVIFAADDTGRLVRAMLVTENGSVLRVAAHAQEMWGEAPYPYAPARCVHIAGVRRWK